MIILMISHAALMLALVASPATAGMFKCQGEKGAILYQDAPCAAGRELRNFDTDPANVSVVPGTPVPRDARAAKPETRAVRPRATGAKHASAPKKRSGDPGERRHVASGMAQGEVVARIGKPDLTSGGRKGKTWVYFPIVGDESTLTTLSLSEGKVVNVERKVMR